MRSLALAGVVVLSGCSLPYADTSFKAMPKSEHMAEGEHHEVNDRGPSDAAPGAKTATGATQVEVTDSAAQNSQPSADVSPADAGAKERVGSVFPSTAQPAGG